MTDVPSDALSDALNRAIRTTFIGTAGGKLRLESTGMTEESHGRRLHFTGFHRDGTPFVVLSAPFTGSPLERAAQMAADIITTHTGVPYMPAPAVVSGLAQTLRSRLTEVTKRGAGLHRRCPDDHGRHRGGKSRRGKSREEESPAAGYPQQCAARRGCVARGANRRHRCLGEHPRHRHREA